MASHIPSIITTNAIPRFLKHIQTANVPAKVTIAYLKTVGFKSSNDSALVPLFKSVGFIDGSGAPTDRWRQYKDTSKAKTVLAAGIREAYSGLFDIYADAERQDNEAIANWIRTSGGASDVTVDRALRAFRALCAEADFGAVAVDHHKSVPGLDQAPITVPAPAPVLSGVSAGGPSININIELHLPPSSDPTVYENLFKAMKENLFNE